MPELILANEYTDVRKYVPRGTFTKDAYAWVKTPPTPIKAVPRRQLRSAHDEEELARVREMSDAHLSQNRLPDQDQLKDAAHQLGHPMHSAELIAKVKRLNPHLIVEDSINCRGSAAFYFADHEGVKQPTNAHFRKGILSEFSVVETDAADLPVRVQYGWREVLLRLVRAGQLSLAQVLRVFGDATTVQSNAWRRSVQKYRN